ncbi:MAG: AtpZ/AtpI family protein [Gemmatimonadetes bacterium]|nr:AtpZ/AtpI family protein [Gemmatimonadota bacterium]
MGPKKSAGRELGEAWRYDTLGYTFAFSVILFAGAGYLLDRWLNTMPWLTIVGTLLGAGLAFVWVFLKVKQDEQAFEAARQDGSAARRPGGSADSSGPGES